MYFIFSPFNQPSLLAMSAHSDRVSNITRL
nr:MAG TPA_asm: hypothetical protein [Caudoviricetes sp.]